MLCIWYSVRRIASNRMFKKESLASFRSLCSQIDSSADDPQSSFPSRYGQKLPESDRIIGCFPDDPQSYFPSRIILTLRIVLTTISNCSSDILAFSFFLWCAKQPNYFHDRASLTQMVSVVSRLAQRFRTVKYILKELKEVGCVIKPQTLLFLLRIYWFGGMYDVVFEAFEEMLNYGYTPNTFSRNIIMDVLFKIGRDEVALRVLKETQVPNFLTYSIAICNLCKLNDLVNLQNVLKIMLGKSYYPTDETFFVILSCYCKVGRIVEAKQILGLLIVLGVPMSVKVWGMLIDGYSKAGNMDVASNLFEKVVESGYLPNVVTCTSLIRGFFASRMSSKAFGILDSMESKGFFPDLVLHNVLIDCLSKLGSYFCKAGYPVGAIEFYDDMIDRGFIADNYTFAGLLAGLCGSGRIGEAVKVYHGLVRSHVGLDSQIHTVIINGLIRSGKLDKAISLIKKAAAEKSELDDVSYTIAINGLLKSDRAGEAYAFFIQMKEIGLTPSKQTYNLILSSFCKTSDVSTIKEILLEMVDAGVEVDHFTLRLMKHLLYGSHSSASLCTLLTDILNSGILPRKEYTEFINELVHHVNIRDTRTYTSNNLDVATSSLDEFQELVVSGG